MSLTGRELIKQQRKDMIFTLLQRGHPQNTNDVALHIGVSYNTAHRYLQELLQGGIVHVAATPVTKSSVSGAVTVTNQIYYSLSSVSAIPQLVNGQTKETIGIEELAEHYVMHVAEGHDWSSAEAVYVIGEVIFDILWAVRNLDQEDIDSALPAYEVFAENARKQLIAAKASLNNSQRMITQLLDNPTLWDGKYAARMVNDLAFPSMSQFQTWLRMMQAKNSGPGT